MQALAGVIILVIFTSVVHPQNETVIDGQPEWMKTVFIRENINRAKHDSPPLVFNIELCVRALKYAKHLAKKCGPMVHSPKKERMYRNATKPSGENIWMVNFHTGFEKADIRKMGEKHCVNASNDWYSEIKDYPWPEFKKGMEMPKPIGHFTQQVWKDSKEVGYGLGYNQGCTIVYLVARYWPGGNIIGKFAQNVLPPKKS